MLTGIAAYAQQDCGKPIKAWAGAGSLVNLKLIGGSESVRNPDFAIDGIKKTAAVLNNGPISMLGASSILSVEFGTPLQIRDGVPDTVSIAFAMPATFKLDIAGTIAVRMYKGGGQQVGEYHIRNMTVLNLDGWGDGGYPFAIFREAVPDEVDRIEIELNTGLINADVSQLVSPIAGTNENTALKIYEVNGLMGVPRMDSMLEKSEIVIRNGESAVFSVRQDKRNTGYNFKWFNGFRDETPIYTGFDFKPEVSSSIKQENYTYYVTIERDGCLLQSKIPVHLIVNPQPQFQGSISPSRTVLNSSTEGETGRLDYTILLVNKGAASLGKAERIFIKDIPDPHYQIQRIALQEGEMGRYDTATGSLSGITLGPGDSIRLEVRGIVDTTYKGILRNRATGNDELGFAIPITEAPFVFVNVKDSTSGNNGSGEKCPGEERICNQPENITYSTAFDPVWGESIQQDLTSLAGQALDLPLQTLNGLKAIVNGIASLDPGELIQGIGDAFNHFLNGFDPTRGPQAPPNLNYAGDGNEATAVAFEPETLQFGQWQMITAHFEKPIVPGDSVTILFSDPATFRLNLSTIRIYQYNKGNQVGAAIDMKEPFAFRNIIPWVSGGIEYQKFTFPVNQTIDAVGMSVAGLGGDLGLAGTRIYEIARRPQKPIIDSFLNSLSVQVQQGEEIRLKVKDEKQGACMLYKWYNEEDLGTGMPFASGPEAVAQIPSGFTGTKYYYLQALANACSDNPSDPLEVKVDVAPSAMLEGVVTTEDKDPEVHSGGTLRYVLIINNNGTITLPDTARIILKALTENERNYKIDSIIVPGGGHFDRNTGELTGVTIPPKGKVSLIITGTIPKTYTGKPINITVSGWHKNGRRIPIRQAPPVSPSYHLKIRKVPDQLKVGQLQKLDYTIIIKNTGTESFPGGAKLYIKDVPREKGYRIDRMYVPENSSGYYNMGDQTFVSAEIPPGATAEIRVEGFLTEEYDGGPINNDVLATDENSNPIDVEPTPTVNPGKEGYKLHGIKRAIKQEGEVKAGSQLDFVIDLFNNGTETMPADAQTYIRDIAPKDYIIQEISEASGNGQYKEPVLTGVTLAPGDSVRLIVRGYLSNNYRGDTIINRAIGRTENGNDIDITPSPVINPGYKLSGNKQPDKLKAKAGEALNYTITLVNSGHGVMPAGQVVYVKDIPGSDYYVIDSISVAGNAGVYTKQTFELKTAAPLLPEAKIMLLVHGHIRGDYKTGEISNKVEVRIDSTNYDIPPAPIVNENKYRMQLAKVANTREPVGPGFPVDFTITLRHMGTAAIKASDKIRVVDTLPAGFQLIGFEPLQGTYDPKTHYWTGLSLNPGQSARLIVKGRVRPDFKGDSLVNKVGGNAPDGSVIEIDTNTGYAVVKIDTTKKLSKLQLRKVSGSSVVTSGDTLDFTIILKNLDNKDIEADTIVVRDAMPEGYITDRIVASTGNYNTRTGDWTDLRIPAGDSVTIQLNGNVRMNFWGKLTNTAFGFDQNKLPIPAAGNADNIAQVTVQVNSPASKYNLLLKKVADRPRIKAGDTLSYTITLFNKGELGITDTTVTVKDTLPKAYIVESVHVTSGNYDLQSGRWSNVTLPAGGSVTLKLIGRVSNTFSGKLVNTVGGLDPDGIPIKNTPDSRSEIEVEPLKRNYDLALAKVVKSGRDLVKPGDSLNFEITLYHNGGDPIRLQDTVTVKDQLPKGYNVLSFEPGQGRYNSTTGQWTGLSLKPGDSIAIMVKGILSRSFTGSTVVNKVNGLDPNRDTIPLLPGREEARINVGHSDTTKYNLLLSKKANSANAEPGGALDFTITMENKGPRVVQPGDTVKVSDQLPAGYTATGFVPSAGKYDPSTSVWTGLSLASGQSVTLLVKGNVQRNFAGNSLTNKVSGVTPDGRPIPADNGGGATVDIRKDSAYNLLLSKKANSANAEPGGALDFTITMENKGPRVVQPGDTVKVSDQLPAGYTATGFVPSAGKYDPSTSVWTGLSLASGQSVTLLVKGNVQRNFAGNSLTNKVSGVTPDGRPIPADNGGGATVDIRKDSAYNLLLSKKANSASAEPGGALDFTITMENKGPRVVQPGDTVKVSDQLPAGYTATGFVPSAGKYDPSTSVWTGLSLASGQSVTLLVKGNVQRDFAGNSLTNKVSGVTPDGRPIPADNDGNATVDIRQVDLVVPNVITPNGDGVNDVLRIKGLEKYKNPELMVLNRWNNLVYRNSNYDNSWSGPGLSEGTYFYVLKVEDGAGKVIIKRGYVMVLR